MAVGSIEQNELIVQVHKAQASVAVISNEQYHEGHPIDNCILLIMMLYIYIYIHLFDLFDGSNIQNTMEIIITIGMDMSTYIMPMISNVHSMF